LNGNRFAKRAAQHEEENQGLGGRWLRRLTLTRAFEELGIKVMIAT